MVSLETYAKFPLAQAFEVHRQAFVGGAKVRAISIHEGRNSILRADEDLVHSKRGDLAPICIGCQKTRRPSRLILR